VVALYPRKALLTPIKEDVGWLPEPVAWCWGSRISLVPVGNGTLHRSKSYHSSRTDYAIPGTLSLETLFTHDARQHVPLRNIPFSKQKK
jgi:hypothetical protein